MAAPPQLKPATSSSNVKQPQQPKPTAKRDVTVLNPPAHAARQGVSQIFEVLLSGTPFMRQLLLQETDVIYECRACRSLFRGLVNFVDHKKNFCTMRVGAENMIAAQNASATTGLQRWLCQDKEVIPIIVPEAPDEDEDKPVKVKQSKHPVSPKTPVNAKQQMVIRKPETTYILVRPIPGTTKAMEQMILKPDQIIHQSQLDNLSNFKTPRQESDGTAKIVGEIAIRQAEKAAKTAQTSPGAEKVVCVEKRDALHTVLKKVKVTSSVVNTDFLIDSPGLSKTKSQSPMTNGVSSSKQVLMVTLGQQKKLTSKQQQQQANKRKAVCKICKKVCKNFTALAWHERVHKKPSFKCALCYSTSQTMFNLKRHLMNVHHLTPSKVESMLNYRDQKLKVQVHDVAPKQTKKQESSDESDESEDENEDNVPTCSICQKTFASNRNVNRHMQIHRRDGHVVNTKPGEPRLSNEQIAKNRVLQIMDEKNLRCRKCHKQLSGLRRLQQHCCNHFGLNRYRCSLCQYENSDYTQMRRHVMGKHGRQFRTIHQISEAIKKMKIGLWINLIKLDNGDEGGSVKKEGKKNSEEANKKVETSKKNESSPKIVIAKKLEIKTENGKTKEDVNKVKSDKNKNVDDDKTLSKMAVPMVVVERASRSRDSSNDRGLESSSNARSSPILSTPIKMLRSPMKKDQDPSPKGSDIVLRNSSSRSSSPGSSRKNIDSPKRETPIRQARLNHRNVSSRVVQNLKLDDEEDVEKAQINMLIDKRLLRCIECNKRFQYMSSLQRHVRVHLLQGPSEKPPGKNNKNVAHAKSQSIDSFINFSQSKCLKCHKRFINLSSLKRHVARHLGYSTYKCRFCSYISRNYTWFKKHLMLSHPNHMKNANKFGTLIASMKVVKNQSK